MKVSNYIAYVLLAPPVLCSLFFIYNVFFDGDIAELKNLSDNWTGNYNEGGFTSAAPIFLGLMAIAGAILLKDDENKK